MLQRALDKITLIVRLKKDALKTPKKQSAAQELKSVRQSIRDEIQERNLVRSFDRYGIWNIKNNMEWIEIATKMGQESGISVGEGKMTATDLRKQTFSLFLRMVYNYKSP